jgi:hypothetical protein
MQRRHLALGALLAASVAATGCSSLVGEGSADAAGVGGAALASTVTHNAAVATGIGLGVQSAALAGVQYAERRIHAQEQNEIARVAGTLDNGAVGRWKSVHDVPLEPDEQGDVTISRTISRAPLNCKEIVFSVDPAKAGEERAFYVATVCQDGKAWKWASAEPATERWGSLQ